MCRKYGVFGRCVVREGRVGNECGVQEISEGGTEMPVCSFERVVVIINPSCMCVRAIRI